MKCTGHCVSSTEYNSRYMKRFLLMGSINNGTHSLYDNSFSLYKVLRGALSTFSQENHVPFALTCTLHVIHNLYYWKFCWTDRQGFHLDQAADLLKQKSKIINSVSTNWQYPGTMWDTSPIFLGQDLTTSHGLPFLSYSEGLVCTWESWNTNTYTSYWEI